MSIRKVVSIDQAEWRIAPVPEWVVPHEPDWVLPPDGRHAIAMLLVDTQHHVATQTQSHRTVRRLYTLAAVQALGQVELEFDPAAHRLQIHEVAIWRQNAEGAWEKRSLARRELFLLRQREQQLEQQMLNGRMSVVALLEDVRVGDALDLAWTLEPNDPMPGLRFSTFFGFVWTVPVGRAYFTLYRDPEHPVTWRVHGQPGVLRPVEETAGERIRWSLERPPIFVPEPNVPGEHWPFALLDVSEWSHWKEVANFATELWAEALVEGSEAVSAEAARLQAGKEIVAAVQAAIYFVQEEVRYLAVDFGHGGGLLPNGAGTVLRRRFGDCKDKSVLLTALLRALGVEAAPLLVAPHWRAAVDWVQPSVSAFSHAIVTFQIEGRRYFVDPTCLGQRGDLTRMVAPPYARGLEVRAGAEGLLTLPELPEGVISLTETFHLDRKQREGRVEQVLRATAWMADDVRAAIARQGQVAFFKQRADVLQKSFPAAAARDSEVAVIDDTEKNVIELRAQYTLPTWGPAGQVPPPIFRYGAQGLGLALEATDGPDQRRQPWALRFPLKIHHRVVVRGRCVQKSQSENFRTVGPGFKYACEVNSQRHQIAFDYSWETTQREVAPEQWGEYLRLRGKAFERTGANVPTRSTTSATVGKAIVLCVVAMGIGLGVLSDRSKRASEASPPSRSVSLPPSLPASRRQVAGEGDRFAQKLGLPMQPVRRGDSTARATPLSFSSALEEQREVEKEMRVASERVQRGDYAGAEPMLERLQRYYSGSVSYHLMRAKVALRVGKMDRAEAAIAAVRELDSSNETASILEATIHLQKGEFIEGRALLEQVLKKTPDNLGALALLGQVAEQVGDKDAARQAWEKLLAKNPGHPDALKRYSLLLWRGGERDKADKIMIAAVQGQPTPTAAIEMAAAEYLGMTNRYAAAVERAQKAAEIAPTDFAAARCHTMALAHAGDKAGAVARAQKMVQDFHQTPEALLALASVAAQAGQNDVAEKAYDDLLKTKPNSGTTYANYGFFLHRIGRTAEARKVLEQATRDYPGNGTVWLNYGVVLEALGDSAGAAAARKKSDALMTPSERETLLR